MAVKLLPSSPITLITTEHSTINKRRKTIYGKLVDTHIFRHYKHIICISKAVSKSLTDWLPSINNKLITIENGINLDYFINNPLPNQLTSKPTVISVGRLHRLKNYKSAIKACYLLNDLKFRYIILGSGREKFDLDNLILSLNLENKITLLGFQHDVPTYLQKSNIFLMPSLWEGFGLSAVEAMASGLPVIVSDVPGVRDVVGTDEVCGKFVDPQDPHHIADQLRQLITNPLIRQKMGICARIQAEKFSINETADKYLDLYSSL
jgi:glycosyltransferase involved in cell wall biosynthesis